MLLPRVGRILIFITVMTGTSALNATRPTFTTDSVKWISNSTTRIPLSLARAFRPPVVPTVLTTTKNDTDAVRLQENPVVLYTVIPLTGAITMIAVAAVLYLRRKRLKNKKRMDILSSSEVFSITPYAETSKSAHDNFAAITETATNDHPEYDNVITTVHNPEYANGEFLKSPTVTQHHEYYNFESTTEEQTNNVGDPYHQIGHLYEIPQPTSPEPNYIFPETLPSPHEVHETSSFVNFEYIELNARYPNQRDATGYCRSHSAVSEHGYLSPIRRSFVDSDSDYEVPAPQTVTY